MATDPFFQAEIDFRAQMIIESAADVTFRIRRLIFKEFFGKQLDKSLQV